MFLLNNLKTTLILAGVLLLITLAFALSFGNPQQEQTVNQTAQTPVPTSFPTLAPPSIEPQPSINNIYNTYSQEYIENQKKINEEEKPLQEQDSKVSNFVDTLPYNGKYIKVSYNIYNNQIYLEYDRESKEAAVIEFADLLKKNNIANINWLSNLQIIER